jgi:hypothetical protein
MEEKEETRTAGKCIPDGANGCQRAAFFKSTCCSSRGNSTTGMSQLHPECSVYARLLNVNGFTGIPSESYGPEIPTDASDAILLKEFKSIIQEHSTHRQSTTTLQVAYIFEH